MFLHGSQVVAILIIAIVFGTCQVSVPLEHFIRILKVYVRLRLVELEHTTIYVVDRCNGCFAVTHCGQILFKYRDPMNTDYGGLALGKHCLFVGMVCEKRLKIRKLNLIGDMIENLSFKVTYLVKTMGTKSILVSITNHM